MPEPYRFALTPAGLKHPMIREFLAAKRRPADGTVALDGTWMLRHALAAGVRLHAVFVCTELRPGADGLALAGRAIDHGATGYQVSEKVLAKMTDRDGPDGIAALGRVCLPALDEIEVGHNTSVIIADGWDMPGNLGTLIRCADGAGASAVLVVEQGFRLNHPLVLKASMGAALAVPVVAAGRTAAMAWLRAHGFRIVAADPAGHKSYRDVDYGGPLAIVIGSERRGLASEWLAAADTVAAIPVLGSCDSLNAAVAGALLLYEALAQRGLGG